MQGKPINCNIKYIFENGSLGVPYFLFLFFTLPIVHKAHLVFFHLICALLFCPNGPSMTYSTFFSHLPFFPCNYPVRYISPREYDFPRLPSKLLWHEWGFQPGSLDSPRYLCLPGTFYHCTMLALFAWLCPSLE